LSIIWGSRRPLFGHKPEEPPPRAQEFATEYRSNRSYRTYIQILTLLPFTLRSLLSALCCLIPGLTSPSSFQRSVTNLVYLVCMVLTLNIEHWTLNRFYYQPFALSSLLPYTGDTRGHHICIV